MFWDRQKVSFHPTSTGHSNLVLLCCLSCISQPPMDRRFAPRDEIGTTNKEGEELSHHGSFDSRYCISNAKKDSSTFALAKWIYHKYWTGH